jgi:hypothetical protein
VGGRSQAPAVHLGPLQIRGKNAVRAFARSGVLEVGCADAFGTRLVPREVRRLTAIDSDRVFVEDVLRRMDPRWSFECRQHDLLAGPVPGRFEVRLEAAYAMDVLEHIPAENEDLFVQNMVCSLTSEGLMERFFHNVFMSSMNDEMVHTGFAPMAHYNIGLGCSPRSGALKS